MRSARSRGSSKSSSESEAFSFSETEVYNLWSFDKTSNNVLGNIGESGVLSVSNLNKFKLNIFPNPVSDTFTIQLNQNYHNIEVEILSISGKLIRKIKSKNSARQNIDITDLSSGMYFLKVKADSYFSIQKVIKL